jgi:hypothetical protein
VRFFSGRKTGTGIVIGGMAKWMGVEWVVMEAMDIMAAPYFASRLFSIFKKKVCAAHTGLFLFF